MVRYSLLRALVFFGLLALLWLVGLRSPDERVLLLLGAALLSMPVSYFALRPFREDYSAQLAARIEARRARRQGEHRISDEEIEDRAVDGEDARAEYSPRDDDDFR